MKLQWIRMVLSALIMGLLLTAFSVAAEPIEAPAKPNIQAIPLINEKDTIPEYVHYYKGKTKVDPSTFSWAKNGISGNALLLDGKQQYLRLDTAQAEKLSAFTFSVWVDRLPITSTNNYKLLTAYKNENRLLAVSLHKQDTENDINGICVELQDGAAEPITLFRPSTDGISTALPANEWHHVAVVFCDTQLAVYIDGTVFLQQALHVSVEAMELNNFIIGGGIYGEVPLSARLDDAVLYNGALSANQIACLAQNIDPLSGATATTTKETLATKPATVPTAISKPTEEPHVFGLPLGLAIVVAALVVVIVVFSVLFTRRGSKQQGGDFS